MEPDALPARTGAELKARVDAERAGRPFLVYRDGDDEQVLVALSSDDLRLGIGRGTEADVVLDFDPQASRLHAEIERFAGQWLVIDDGLSSNGSFVNGERLTGRRRLHDQDVMRFGSTALVFRNPADANTKETMRGSDLPETTEITDAQRRVLVALCRPFNEGSEFATPATNKQIATELTLSVEAVKAHLRSLFERFQVGDLPQNQKRVRLAELALRSGVIGLRDISD